ncbi:pancreatic triacylglycerol lipase-like [Stegodyphus dumicola]|uniref:pancreatic triacylglycerol lipase-like n=1 Tax=Stegodyphus dumicola TaxID=202533 RepID=UPI0015B3286C|nr:pancreatic triacylglycerol lipase-like [Stegodyphus dumicola]
MAHLLLQAVFTWIICINVKAIENPTSGIIVRSELPNRNAVDKGELGIFRTGSPFDYPQIERWYSLPPHSRGKINTKFRFFSSTNKYIPQSISNMNFSAWNVKESGFCNRLETYIIIHDYLGGNSEWQLRLKNALLNNMDCNVFIVGWFDGSGEAYPQSVANIRVVGAEVGLFMQRLVNASNLYPEFVHIIGHGLGAHAAGYAGKWFRERQNKLIGRITGLDPAGPYFNGVKKAVRLDKRDAGFVDVIHTNADGKRLAGFGLKEPIGHVDFYPNGGQKQPFCSNATVEIIPDFVSYKSSVNLIQEVNADRLHFSVLENMGDLICSHYRACDYFIATIEDPDCKLESLSCYSWESYFQGFCGSCENNACIRMGFYANLDAYDLENESPLKLFLGTKPSPPYCYPELSNSLSGYLSVNKIAVEAIYRFKL